ncbi:hypothetical protein ACFYYB_34525 [Streptomyces sp. NPDC002886]|uniref:hypothetical protein n=1 Tax=Streptomyces sp. NPDC002886 TaxID=3364667 RepID=UPI0036C8FF73
MKKKIILLAGAAAVAGGVLIAAPAVGQASTADHGLTASAPAPSATVALGYELSDSDLVTPMGEWGVGRRTPRS